MSNEWCKNLKNDIIGIPLSKDPPPWNSSPPPPEHQLRDLGNRGPYVKEFQDYEKDLNFANLIKGKRIAYVCPSPHLKGLKMGKSKDVIRALQWASDKGMQTCLITANPIIEKINKLTQVVLGVKYYHTAECLSLLLQYELTHGSGKICPSINEEERSSE